MGTGTGPHVRRKAISLFIAAVLAAALLFLSLRGVEWRKVGRLVEHADAWRLTLGAALATIALFLRACRWRILLNAEGDVKVSTAFWATAAGYFGNNFLPARAGELVRTLMVSSRSNLQKGYVLATALADRFADTIALLAISAVVVLTLRNQPAWLAHAVQPFVFLALIGVLCIAFVPLLGRAGRRVLEWAPVPGALRPRLIANVEQAVLGIRAFHHVSRLTGFLALTAVVWCLDAVGTVIAGAALGLAIPLGVAFLLIAALGLASALPSTPGYVGIYQFVAVTVLTPFGFSRSDAIAFILVAQALMYVVIGVWGALGFVRYRRMPHS